MLLLFERVFLSRFFIYLAEVIVLTVFSTSVYSHAGSHENKNCFVSIAKNTLRFSGYQFQGLHPDQSYCRTFPYLGQIIIKIEPVNEELKDKQVSLQLLKLDSWTNFNNAFSSVKKNALQSFNSGVVMMQADIQQRGIYALNIELRGNGDTIITQNYLFLAGVPIAKILVFFSGAVFLLLLIFVAANNFRKKRQKASKISSKL